MKKMAIPLVSLMFLQGCILQVQAGDELIEASQQLTLTGAQLNRLQAETGAGSLQIIGEPNRQQIDVEARVHRYEDTIVNLSLRQQGTTAMLVATTEQKFCMGQSPYIDVVVRMPAALALQLTDGSGNIEIDGLTAAIEVEDGSGNLQIRGGALAKITDGSGDIDISGIQGDLQINDGSGGIDAQNISGNVDIDDGSGNIYVNEVKGTVQIEDGSGNINVKSAGALIVTEAGSGNLNYSQIHGKLQVPHDDKEQI